MQKFIVFLIMTTVFAVSCSGSKKAENNDNAVLPDEDMTDVDEDNLQPDEDNGDTTPDDGDTTPDNGDTAPDNGDSIPDDEDPAPDNGDTTPDNGDTTPDDGDSAPDDGDTTPDDGDSAPDGGDTEPDEDADADSGEPEEPCRTIDGKLWWSPKTADPMNWLSALNYCEDLNKCEHSDWHLPTIDELKTLLKWRRESQCKVSDTDNCLSFTDCWTCSSCCHDCTLGGGGECNYSSYYYDGRYSKLDDSGSLWSSSVPTEYTHSAWTVNFNAAQVYNKSKSNTTEVYVRCVRGQAQ